MYKGILFDLDNTLLNYDRSELQAMHEALGRYGLDANDADFWEPFWHHFSRSNYTYWTERFSRNLHILEVLELSFRDAFDEIGAAGHSPRLFAESYWERFCGLYIPEEGAEDALVRLHGRYRMGIVSNGVGEAQRLRLQAGRLERYFDALAVSDDLGIGKPDPRIFQAALDQMGLAREEVLFVGDSLRDDYEGALRAGIDFIFYNRKRTPLEPHIRPKYAIERLDELERVLL